MNPRLVATALGAILVILVIGWEITLVRWQKKGYRGSDLRRRQRRVRKVAAVIVFVLFAIATVSWRLLASDRVRPGRGIYLVPLASIVCLVGVIAVRGLWFLTYPKFGWLQSVSNRASLQAWIIVSVSVVTAIDMTNVVTDQLFFFCLRVFIFLTLMVALGSFVLEQQLPDTADMLDLNSKEQKKKSKPHGKTKESTIGNVDNKKSPLRDFLISLTSNIVFFLLVSLLRKPSVTLYLKQLFDRSFIISLIAIFVPVLFFFLLHLLLPRVRLYLKQF